MKRLHMLRHSACVLALLLPLGAQAQEDSAPLIQIPFAEEAPPTTPATPMPPARDAGEVAPVAAAPIVLPLLPRLAQANDQSFARLQGESGAAEFRLYSPASDRGATFQIHYRTSINTLPEYSRIRVILNDNVLGEFEPSNFSDFGTVDLGVVDLEAGENTVRIEAVHHHRIFCGTDVSFALWTEVDLRQSGVKVSPATLAPQAADFLAAMAAQSMRNQPIEVRGDLALADPGLTRSLVARLGSQFGGSFVSFRAAPFWAQQGAAPALARVAVLPPGSGGTGFRRGGDGAIVLVLDGASAQQDLDRLLPEAAQRTVAPLLQPGSPVPLHDLGFADSTTRDHYFRQDLTFRLPQDWLVLASQKARLGLLYGFPEGLPTGSILLVKVNGESVRLLPLDREGGEVQPQLDVQFNARLLRPGLNSVTFEALIPGDPPDAACPIRQDDVLTILGNTTIQVPESPRMQLANLAAPLSRLGPEDVARVGVDEGSAVLTLAALLQQPRAEAAGARLTVVDVGEASQIPIDTLNVSRQALVDAVSPGEPTLAPAATGTSFARLLSGMAPGDGPAEEWLAQNRGVALIAQPDLARPDALWLLTGPQADMGQVARAIAAGREAPDGPRGQISVLRADGTWASWTSADQVPVLNEPLTLNNLRSVLGNYASWLPLSFVGLILAMAWVSGIVALTFVAMTGKRFK